MPARNRAGASLLSDPPDSRLQLVRPISKFEDAVRQVKQHRRLVCRVCEFLGMSPVILGRQEVDRRRLARSRRPAASSSPVVVSGSTLPSGEVSANTLDRVSDISRQLERAIVQGEYSPGQRLPPERLLSSQFQVSRSVIREALGRLASLGLVESRQEIGRAHV
mgnify:CR=1 FL=1